MVMTMDEIRSARLRLALALLLSAAPLMGCRVDKDDIEYWKGTIKGPGKIVAVLLSERYPLELRTRAALALVEMERNDVDGVAELQKALTEIGKRDRATLIRIIQEMVPKLEELMRSGGNKAGSDSSLGPPALQVRAKDAAFLLIKFVERGQDVAPLRDRLINAVVSWYVVDFNARSLAGKFSAEQIVRHLKGRAAARLVDAMNAKLPGPTLIKIAELIGQFGDADTKERAAKRLIEIEREILSEDFVKWVEDKIKEQLAQQGRSMKPEAIRRNALRNREKWLLEGVYPAAKHLASVPLLADHLIQVAALKGTDKFTEDRRVRALQAVEDYVGERHVETLLALAINRQVPGRVRSYAFDCLARTRSRKALPKLWPLVEDPQANPQERGQAGAAILAIGGPAIVDEFLRRLPNTPEVQYAPEELTYYAQKMSQMSPPPTERLRAELKSPNWWNRVIAIRYLERRGEAQDVQALKQLQHDTTPLQGPGWKERNLTTVGDVAKQAAQELERRLKVAKTPFVIQGKTP